MKYTLCLCTPDELTRGKSAVPRRRSSSESSIIGRSRRQQACRSNSVSYAVIWSAYIESRPTHPRKILRGFSVLYCGICEGLGKLGCRLRLISATQASNCLPLLWLLLVVALMALYRTRVILAIGLLLSFVGRLDRGPQSVTKVDRL